MLPAGELASSKSAETARVECLRSNPPLVTDFARKHCNTRERIMVEASYTTSEHTPVHCGGNDSILARLLLRNSPFKSTPKPGPGGTPSLPLTGAPVAVAIEA